MPINTILPVLLECEAKAVIACEQAGKPWDYSTVCQRIAEMPEAKGLPAAAIDTMLSAHYDRLNGID